jgi:hypothetical protein
MAISGRYEGVSDDSTEVLHVRVDVDTDRNPPLVTNRVSGDRFSQAPESSNPLRFHRGSWVTTSLTHTPPTNGHGDTIQGDVLFLEDRRTGELLVTLAANGGASVHLTFPDSSEKVYSCTRVSPFLRDVTLDISVSQVTFRDPDYDPTQVLPPDGFQTPPLKFCDALGDAGISVSRPNAVERIDDAEGAEFHGWNDDSLNDAIEDHFLHNATPAAQRPAWALWALLGSVHVSGPTRVGGIMFDTHDLNRQGFAVFKGHDWFNPLPAPGAVPANPSEAMALRKYLFTWVHEIGHAFNLPHCWQRTPPDDSGVALTWTNDDLRFPPQHGKGFWDLFGFAFDEHDLIHLRHGDLRQVIPGGADFSTSRELQSLDLELSEPGDVARSDAALELLLRCRRQFEYMAPVHVEVRLRNLSGVDQRVRTHLAPEDGGLVLLIRRRGSARTTVYAPLVCRLQEPEFKTLAPASSLPRGIDRHSEEIDLTYGRHGFSFAQPGSYSLQAVYRGVAGDAVLSNVLTIHVKRPRVRDEEKRSQDFFTRDVGKTLQLGGSRSEFLRKGFEQLTDMTERYRGSAIGSELAASIVRGIAEPLWSVRDGRLRQVYQGDSRKALESTEPALAFLSARREKVFNLSHRRLSEARAKCHAQQNDYDAAARELSNLHGHLHRRGVRTPVLREVLRERDAYLAERR